MREMAFVGFEKDRKTLKFRCPAAHYGFTCAGRAECEKNARVGPYGRVVRVPLSYDRRIFTPIAHHTDKWKKAYNRRTAVERVTPAAKVQRAGVFQPGRRSEAESTHEWTACSVSRSTRSAAKPRCRHEWDLLLS